MSERIPCPVDGCDEEFDDEASAAAHMKEKHRDDFAPPPMQIIPPGEPPADQVQTVEKKEMGNEDVLAMVPPGMLEILDKRMDDRITAAIPQIVDALKSAIAAGAPGGAAPPGGGVIPGSPVTPAGADLLRWITRQDQPSDMENLAKMLTQARAISDVLNPPTIWDRVMQNAVLRSLGKAGLVTDTEMKELLQPAAKP